MAGINAADAAVVCSIALQYGVPLQTIRHALMRDSQGRASRAAGGCSRQARGRAMRPEQQIHRAVVQHLRQRGAPGLVFLHPANGGFRRRIEARIFSGLGVRAGAADLLLWHRGKATRSN